MTARIPAAVVVASAILGLVAAVGASWPGDEQHLHAPGDVCELKAVWGAARSFVPRAPVPAIAGDAATINVTYIGFDASPQGPQAQAAFQYAVDIWKPLISSPVPINIEAEFRSLAGDSLGSAAAAASYRNFTSAPQANTWYPAPLAEALHGQNLTGNTRDISATVNSTFTTGGGWYFGTDGQPGATQWDLVSVVLHELGHGLGFAGFASVDNTTGEGSLGSFLNPGIFDSLAATETGALLWTTFTNPSVALGSQLRQAYAAGNPRGPGVYSVGTNTIAANGGVSARLYTPATWDSELSYTHLDESTYPQANANSLMTPTLVSGEANHNPGPVALSLFADLGWTTCALNVPETPTGASAVRGNAQAAVSFTAPATPSGRPVVDYLVTASPGGATGVGTSSPVTVSGLTNGTSYTFTVAARNCLGPGTATAATSAVTPGAVPDAPTQVAGTRGDGQVSVAFTAPASNGFAITNYTVTASPGGATGSGTASPVVVTGLTNGSAYTFTVTATNAIGTGAASAASVAVTPATVPGAPTGVIATAGDGEVSVSFTPPASNGGAAITRYTVTASPGGEIDFGTASPLLVTDLTNGTEYTFTVTATNEVGVSAASAPSAAVTPAPPRPTITVTPASLAFAATKDGAAGAITNVTGPQSVSVSFNTGAASWTVSANQPWVSLSTTSGTGSGMFTASISDPSNVIAGNTSLSATITLTSPTATNSPVSIAVTLSVDLTNGATTVAAIGGFDSPAAGANGVVGAIAVTGWALDDIGVERVELWRNCLTPIDTNRAGVCRNATPTGAPDKVFIGNASFVPGARTDIETNPQFSGYPQAYRAGWGYLLLTNALPNQTSGATEGGQGPVTLFAFAVDREGRYTELGSKAITLDNDNATVPFGAIDTPEQGGTVTAAIYANFGWAMTRRQNAAGVDVPKCIARSRYRVYIDGVARTLENGVTWHPNLERADLTAAYPGLCDSANSLAAYYIDVTDLALPNGTHTIGWDVYDDNGTVADTSDDNVAGIGSRFFNILVAAADAPAEDRLRDRPARRGAASDITALPATSDRLIRARVGPIESTVVTVDPACVEGMGFSPCLTRRVQLPAGSRLVVDLGGPVSRGYLIVGDELRDLPIGSTLDAAKGQFYWQPPVPFFGPFELAFVSGDGGSDRRTNLSVVITDPTAGGDPEITITSPRAGANPNPVITVTGTVRDPRAVSGTGITTVHVWAYPDGAGCTRPGTACTTPIFLGEAALVNGAYQLVTAPLAPGTYDLAVFAWVARTGTWAPAATVNIAVR